MGKNQPVFDATTDAAWKRLSRGLSQAMGNARVATRNLAKSMGNLNHVMGTASEKLVDQAGAKKRIRDAIKDADILSVNSDHGSLDLSSVAGGTIVSSLPPNNVPIRGPEPGTVTMTIKYRPSEKIPKFNAKEVKKDQRAIGKVLKKK